MPAFPYDCGSLERQVCVLYTFKKPVHIVRAQHVFGECIMERQSSMRKGLPAQLLQETSKALNCYPTLENDKWKGHLKRSKDQEN